MSAKEQDVVIHERAVKLLKIAGGKRRAEVQPMDLSAKGGAEARERERLIRHFTSVCRLLESGKPPEAGPPCVSVWRAW